MKRPFLTLLLFAFASTCAYAQIVDPFALRYQVTQKGSIEMLANSAVSCNGCTANNEMPPGGFGTNNANNQTYIDNDGVAATFMSSSDSLNLPACSEITWAGLYWTGKLNDFSPTTTANYNIREQVRIRAGNGAYINLTADETIDNTTGKNSYHCYKDVTNIIQNNGNSRYSVANIVVDNGSNTFGGWALIVVYSNPYETQKNLTVFDGLANVASGVGQVNIPISGFLTPPSGPVNFELGVVAHDGDRAETGDQLQFNGSGTFVSISDALHPANDVFNSTIASNGTLTPFRVPSLNNTLGHDANIFSPNNASLNYIGNNATTATVRVTTGFETILTSVVTSAIEVYEPDLKASVNFTDLNGGTAQPGDILEFTISAKNIGSDPSNNTVVTDTLDPRFTYIPGTIEIVSGPNAGVKSDAADADQAEFDPINNVVKAFIGTGATGTTGGTVNNSSTGADSTVIKFRVELMDDCLAWQCGDTLENYAYVAGYGNVSGNLSTNNGSSDALDANGCPTTESGDVIVDVGLCPPPIITYDDSLCVGDSLIFSFPASPGVIYTWNGPNGFTSSSNNPSIPNVDMSYNGTYNLNITWNAVDCLQDTAVTVFVSENPTIQLNQIKNDSCFNLGEGFIDIDGMGNGPFTYDWSNGATTNVANNLNAGNYTVTVTDDYGCKVSDTFDITEPTELQIATSITSNYNGQQISCYGASDGSAQTTASGGIAPYSYSWFPSLTSTDVANGLDTGFHVVTLIDANGCVIQDSVYLNQPDSLSLDLAVTSILCFNGSDGALDLTVSSGTAGYEFLWNHGPTAEDVSNLTEGTYGVQVTDTNGCSSNISAFVNQPLDSMSISAITTDVLCFGDATGAIDISVTGGNPPYSFNWNSGQTSEDISSITSGTYTITVTDSNNCVQFLDIDIAQPAAPLTLTETHLNALCTGGIQGSIDLTVTGGTAGYTYLWNNNQTTEDIANLNAGTYNVMVTDAHNCIDSLEVIITDPDAVVPTETHTDVTCFNGADGAIDLTVTGGTPGYTYVWSNGASTKDVNNLSAGNYFVDVYDANNCGAFISAMITQPTTAVVLNLSMTPAICFGDSTGSVNVSATGGIPGYTYLWNTSDTDSTVNQIPSGTYVVEVIDANGCITIDSIAVTEPPLLEGIITHTDVLCFGDASGSVHTSITGGVPGYDYLWNTTATTDSIFNVTAGPYEVLITDQNGCTLTLFDTILQPNAPLSISFDVSDNLCFGDSSASIDVMVAGGTPTYSYQWDHGPTIEDITNITAGTYTITVTDGNNCILTSDTTVIQPTPISVLDTTVQNVSCKNLSDGSIDFTPTGGTPTYTFQWDDALTSTTEDIDNLPDGTYTVVVTDANNCVDSFSIIVTEPDSLLAAYSFVEPLCFGYSDGSLTALPTGGTTPYTYAWNNGPITALNDNIPTGNYTVQVTDANNCVYELDCELNQPDQLEVSFIADNTVGCNPFEVNFANTSEIQHQCDWDFGNGMTASGCDVYNTYEDAGTYTVTLSITSNIGCQNSVTYTDYIIVHQTPTAVIEASPKNLFASLPESNIQNESIGASNFEWNMGDGTGDYFYFEPGLYTFPIYQQDTYTITLIAISNEGCIDSTDLTIEIDNDLIMYVPNSFTPDGDEFNNVFKPEFGAPVSEFHLIIFNRWGQIVFESYDPAIGWDGTFNGQMVQDGTYSWEIKTSIRGNASPFVKRGHVNILR